ncbi:MAG: TRAP transporter fused permease subunit [Spirochaetes bacterium]|nr:TRAP transporter fused permease subunit [Spirochaetota bacterium]
MTKVLQVGILLGSFLFALFHLLLPVYAFLPALQARAVHLLFMFWLIFGGGMLKKGKVVFGDLLLFLAGVGISFYVFLSAEGIVEQYGVPTGWGQTVLAFLFLFLVIEATRREIQPALPILAFLFLLYALFGHWIPGTFGHPRYDLHTLAGQLFLTTGGIWGLLVGVSTDVIAIFVFFGAFMFASGGGAGFMRLSIRLAGKYSGGPAKVATVASALFGSISGSASANVATTGAFTIPMMKRLKYSPEVAAAVEAAASTGGQIMPPIMGAGAFVLAELTETPYLQVAIRSLLPALFYFLSVGVGIHFYAKRKGYVGLSAKELPPLGETVRSSVFFLIPFGVLLAWMTAGYTPQYAAFWASLVTLVFAFFTEDLRWSHREAWQQIRKAVLDGAKQAAVIASISACAQIIIAVIALTGLGVKISSFIVSVSQGKLFLSLILIALTSIVLGMQVPTTAAYIMAVVIGGPVLVNLGIPPLVAHLFVFYFAILSAITPPICGAVFIAAGMAGSDWFKTALLSMRLSFAAFFIPFIFVYDQALLLRGGMIEILTVVVRTGAATVFLSAGLMKYWRKELGVLRSGLLLVAGALQLVPSIYANLLGAVPPVLFLFF